ncbi:hypothetical protein DD237_008388 [Peronospora effusa]|uniref:JmjC domain-containing protein n=1 Tax=Peronospora effusa TaxID=542832 RepID=A0A3R7XSK1_9STRA|nr:hypothetical protein DD237_008388 [Peronospora effusa]
MAATGMGADTPPIEPPRQMLTLTSSPSDDDKENEDKHDYRADDEEEDEVDDGFNDIPIYMIASDNESSDFSADEMTRTGDVNPHEFAKQRSDVHVSANPAGFDTDARVLQEIALEHHTVIQDTTVVNKYLYDDHEDKQKASDSVHRDNNMMTVAETTSSAVIDRVTVSTLEPVASDDTRELGDSIYSHTLCNRNQHVSREGVVDSKLTHQPIDRSLHDENDEIMNDDGKEEKLSAKKGRSSTDEESLSDTGQPMEVEPEEDRVIDTPTRGDVDPFRELEDEKSSIECENQHSLQESSIVLAAPLIAVEGQNGANGRSNAMKATSPLKATKRKQNLSPRRDSAEESDTEGTGDNGGHPSPASSVAITQTPRRSTRISPKKLKKTPTSPKSPQSKPLRRSSRVKVESPKFTYPVKNLANRVHGSGGSSSATKARVRKRKNNVTTSNGVVARKKQDSQALGRGNSQLDEVEDDEDKVPVPSSAAMMQRVKSEDGSCQQGLASSLVHLMGTEALAAKLKSAFQRTSFAGNAPIFRFQQLIEDDVTGLRHLNVFNLLDAVNQLDGPITQIRLKLPGVRRTTGQDRVDPVSKAKARSLESCSLCFPAPRRVAEQFIVPLAKELGLEYAMQQHTATLMSCPLADSIVDWRFHRTETVVFQLGGKSVWKIKRSQVEHPLQCFHPESWQLDNMTHVVKTHRVATIDKATLGFLSTPAEDLDVFDKPRDQEATTQGHHLLKPGSVAYLPAGAWFEVKTQGLNALWIEVQLASMTYENLMFSALKQLAWGDKQWRMGVQLYPGNRGQFKATRHHVEACLKSLRNKMTELEGGDLLPEYRGTDDMHDLVARGLIHDTGMSPYLTRNIEVDLTNPKFKLKHEKIYKDAAYRVNPVAVLMSVAEIPHLPVHESVKCTGAEDRTSGTVRTPHRALIKALKPKPKHMQALRTLTHRGKHTYMLDELFGNDKFQSQLHVKFQCSAEDSRMVEWLRHRGSEPFDVEEFSSCDSTFHYGTRPARSAKNLLRFLCFVGYVTRLKAP